MYNTTELREHIDDLYSLHKIIDKALDCADGIGDHDEDEVLASLTKEVEGLAIALGVAQKIRTDFLNLASSHNLTLK